MLMENVVLLTRLVTFRKGVKRKIGFNLAHFTVLVSLRPFRAVPAMDSMRSRSQRVVLLPPHNPFAEIEFDSLGM